MISESDRDLASLSATGGLALAGLLLVFLPFFTQTLRTLASATGVPQWKVRALNKLLWGVPSLIALAGLVATFGIVTVWGEANLASWAASGLVVLVWSVALLALVAVILGA